MLISTSTHWFRARGVMMELTSSGQRESRLTRVSRRVGTAAALEEAPEQVGPHPQASPGPLGIVFVHGIGSQRRGQTLLDWSGPIIRALSGWARTAPGVLGDPAADRVVRSEIDFEGESLPFVTVDIPGVAVVEDQPAFPPQTWVMTEAWWAERVSAPSLGTMIDWCGRQGAVAQVVERLIAHLSGGGSPGIVVALSRIGFGLFLSTACTILLLLYAVARAIAAVIPIQVVRDAITRFQLDTLLTTWWGGAYLLLDDPVQSANIRGRLTQAIGSLRARGCDRIAVIAHSGGTIVAYMALSDPAYDAHADTLITHGEAISMGRFIDPEPRLAGQTLRLGGPDRPARWRDFWATHDPAPCGTLRPEFGLYSEDVVDKPGWPGSEPRRDVRVWNRRSVLADHGTYWSNDEEFVYPLLAELDVAGTAATSSRFRPSELGMGDSWVRRRWQRVVMLTLWVRMLFVIPLFATVGAFVLPVQSLIIPLRDATYGVLGTVPGAPALASTIGGFRLPSPVGEAAMGIGLLVIAIVVLAAFVHAALPIGQAGVWPQGSPSRWIVWLLDYAPLLVAIALVVAAVPRFIEWFGGRGLGIAPVALVLVAAAIIGGLAVATASPAERPVASLQTFAARTPAITAAALFFAVIGIVLSVVYTIIAVEDMRNWLVGTLTAFVVFQALGKVGQWRWSVWDEREREAFRERLSKPLGRGWPAVQITLLAACAVLAGLTILVGWTDGVYLTFGLVAIMVLVSVLRDAALRASPVVAATGTSA